MIDREIFRQTQQLVEFELMDLGGLIAALEVCIKDHRALSTNDPQNRPIHTLLSAIIAKSDRANEIHDQAWKAAMAHQAR